MTTNITTSPCPICNGDQFDTGPGGRLSFYGHLPFCLQCQSLERHRAFRKIWDIIRQYWSVSSSHVLQFSHDLVVDRRWFGKHELSIYGQQNSIDIQQIQRNDQTYDIVICNHVLEHVPNPLLALQELVRITKDDGFLQISVPDPYRREVTDDWGYAKQEDHGHYRIFGRDVYQLFQQALPDHYILTIVDSDPVTDSEDVVFLISRSYTIRSLFPFLSAKDFQKLDQDFIAPDLQQLALPLKKKVNSLNHVEVKLFFWPDYTVANPYQKLLYSKLWSPISATAADIGVALAYLQKNLSTCVIFHQHWTGAILYGCKNESEADQATNVYLSKLKTFKDMGGHIIWTVHNTLNHEGLFASHELRLIETLIELSDYIQIHSEHTLTQTNQHYVLNPEKIMQGPHGSYIDYYPNETTRNTARCQLGIDQKAIVFLFLGQIRAYKGLENLLTAFEQLNTQVSSAKLIIAGDAAGISLKEQQLIDRLQAHIIYHPRHIEDHSLQNYLNAADVSVLPYHHVLNSGSALLSLSFGCPFIAPNFDSLKELLPSDLQNLLYAPNTSHALLQKMLEFCSLDKVTVSRMRDSAIQHAKTQTWNAAGKNISFAIAAMRNTHQDSQHNLHEDGSLWSEPKRSHLSKTATVLVHYGNLDDTTSCIYDLLSQTISTDIFVVSNDENLSAFLYLKNLFPTITVIQSAANNGYAAGNNIALQEIRRRQYTYIWLVNPDIVMTPDTLNSFQSCAIKHPEYAGIGPVIYFSDRPDTIWFGGGEVKSDDGLEAYHTYHEQHRSILPQHIWETTYITGACLFFRAEMLNTVGLLPEEFFLYFEETQWCISAGHLGYKFAVDPTIKIWHHKRSQKNNVPTNTYLYYYTRNLILMSNRINPSDLDKTLRKLEILTSKWIALFDINDTDSISLAKMHIEKGIRDGLAGVMGKQGLALKRECD
jgi:GT2 family glycosyltransferase/glycosyltransferase involved in cell wall biosynthesis